MKKLFVSVIVASTLLTANAFADGKHEGKDRRFGKNQPNPAKIYRKLDLTNEQKTQMKAIFKEARNKDARPNMAERKAKMDKRRAIIEAKTLDIEAVNQLADEHTAKIKSRFVKMMTAEHKMWQLLTPEQQAKAKASIKKRAERIEKREKKRAARKNKN